MGAFTLIVNSGRSGSSYLAALLRLNLGDDVRVAHEDIPVQVSRPRRFNRALDEDRLAEVLADPPLRVCLDRWVDEVGRRSVIETGWTAAHLAPVLAHLFGDSFRYVVLHRDPVSVALSRANLGNYHARTFYDDAHEVAPTDPRSIAPEYAEAWPRMNHFEKCLFWWYVVYSEAQEFERSGVGPPGLVVPSAMLFSAEGRAPLLDFLGMPATVEEPGRGDLNEVPRFMRESFPIGDEWRAWSRHPEILAFAAHWGYQYDDATVEALAARYRLPDTTGARWRHRIGYWHHRHAAGETVRRATRRGRRVGRR